MQYPHTMAYAGPGTPAVQDENGNWQPGTGGSEVTQACRAVPSASGEMITLADGQKVAFSYKVQMPLTAIDVPAGTAITITITATGGAKAKGTVKQFSREQMHCRLWL